MKQENLKHSEDGRVVYDPKYHTYNFGTRRLKGVTTLIGEYKNKFDAPKVAAAYVAKHGGDVTELLAKWKAEGESSCIAGTAVHDLIERFILSNTIHNTGLHPKENVSVKFIEEVFITGRLIPVDAEVIVYDEAAGIASMIDCIAKDQQGRYWILDWKTNKTISADNYGKFMFPPFNNIPDANLYHYSIQVGLYKRMHNKYPITGAYIVHFGLDNYELIKPVEIPQIDKLLCTAQ